MINANKTKRFSAVIQNFAALSASWLLANALLTFGFYFIGFLIFVYDLYLFWQVLLLLLLWLSISIAKLRLTSVAKIVVDGAAVVNSLNRQCLSAIAQTASHYSLAVLSASSCPDIRTYVLTCICAINVRRQHCSIIRQPTTAAVAWLGFGVWLTSA